MRCVGGCCFGGGGGLLLPAAPAPSLSPSVPSPRPARLSHELRKRRELRGQRDVRQRVEVAREDDCARLGEGGREVGDAAEESCVVGQVREVRVDHVHAAGATVCRRGEGQGQSEEAPVTEAEEGLEVAGRREARALFVAREPVPAPAPSAPGRAPGSYVFL